MCKGSTADSDSVCEGSNPSPAAKVGALDIAEKDSNIKGSSSFYLLKSVDELCGDVGFRPVPFENIPNTAEKPAGPRRRKERRRNDA